jgi:hypothetical protein
MPLARNGLTEEIAPMSGIRSHRGIAALAGILLSCGIAFGQAPAQPPAGPAPAAPETQPAAPPSTSMVSPDKKSMTITSGSTMTKWKWEEVKAKWAREKGKWADCRSQAKEQKLHGPKSWHFITDCMIKVARPQPAGSDKSTR